MQKQTTTRENVFEQIDGIPVALASINTENKKAPSKTSDKERITVQIKKDTIERVKDAVYWERMTVSKFVEEALEVALTRLENEREAAFPKRKSELKPGRPIK